MTTTPSSYARGPCRPLLTLSLGNAPFRLPLKDRLRYKHDYEQFKLRWTSVGLVMALANFLWIDALWLDKVTQFLLLWFYTTTTVC